MKVKENIPTIPNYIIKKQNRILLITLFCIFAVFQSGLRDIKTLPSYNDTPNYVRKYQEASRASWEMLFKNFSFYSSDYGERDLGYPIFIKMTQAIYNDFTFFMFLTAFIFIVPFGMLIYKYVKSFWGIILSFLIYFGLYTNIVNSFMRQAIALGIILWGIKYICNSDWKKYFSLAFIAFLIHASSILAFPLYFFPRWGSSRKCLLAALIISPYLMLYTSNIIAFFATGTQYEKYAMEDSLSPINFIFFLILSATITFLFYNRIKDYPDSRLLISGVVGSTLLIPIVWLGGTAIRLSFYYSVFIVPIFPVILDNANLNKTIRKIAYLIGIFFFIYFIYRKG